MSPETSVGLAISLPLLGAVGIGLTGRHPNLREGVTVVTALIVFGLVSSLVPGLWQEIDRASPY